MDTIAVPPPTAAPPGLAAILARLATGGDERTWQALITVAAEPMARVCRRALGEALADDALQEALLQVRDHAGRFVAPPGDPDAAAMAWLLRIATHVSLSLARSRRRSRRRDSAAATAERHDARPEESMERADEVAIIRRELAALPDAWRTPIALHHLAGLPLAAVADALALPLGTVKTRIHRGLARLRPRLVQLGVATPALALLASADAEAAAIDRSGLLALRESTRVSQVPTPWRRGAGWPIAAAVMLVLLAGLAALVSAPAGDAPPADADPIMVAATLPAPPPATPPSHDGLQVAEPQEVEVVWPPRRIDPVEPPVDPGLRVTLAPTPPISARVWSWPGDPARRATQPEALNHFKMELIVGAARGPATLRDSLRVLDGALLNYGMTAVLAPDVDGGAELGIVQLSAGGVRGGTFDHGTRLDTVLDAVTRPLGLTWTIDDRHVVIRRGAPRDPLDDAGRRDAQRRLREEALALERQALTVPTRTEWGVDESHLLRSRARTARDLADRLDHAGTEAFALTDGLLVIGGPVEGSVAN